MNEIIVLAILRYFFPVELRIFNNFHSSKQTLSKSEFFSHPPGGLGGPIGVQKNFLLRAENLNKALLEAEARGG